MKTWQIDFQEFGKRLRRLREERELTPIQVAKSLAIPISTYREWENGRAIRGLPYVRIAEILQITLQELMSGEKSGKSFIFESLNQLDAQLAEHRRQLMSFL